MTSKRKADKKGRGGNTLSSFIAIERYEKHSAAYVSLSPVAKCAYVELLDLYNGSNNGKIALSIRGLAAKLKVGKSTADRAFSELEDRGFVEALIERARAAKCSALMLTLDLQVLGQRHKDIKNGLSAPPKPTIANLINLATKPRWCLGMLGTKRRSFGNIEGHAQGVGDLSSLSAWTAEQFDPALTWADVEWVKKRWGGKLILKGIMDAEDARLAADSGADALIVSNHGGRQLDGAPSSIAALPAIAEAVGSRLEVWMDGGIRSGQDVLKAWALGARGTLIGRSFLYGLGAMGEAGVTRCLEIIRNELDLTMAFCGHTDLRTVDRGILLPGTF